jgi:hypothetical protein
MPRLEEHIIDLSSPLTLAICLVKIASWKGNLSLDKDEELNA